MLDDTVEVWLDEKKHELAQPGPCFGSKLIKTFFGWQGDAKSLRRIDNPSALARIVVLDTWLRNSDRHCRNPDGTRGFYNPGNLLLVTEGASQERFRIVAIDFGHSFGGPTWTAGKLTRRDAIKDTTIYGCFTAFQAHIERAAICGATERLRSITRPQIEKFLAGVPNEWGLRTTDRQAIVDFLQRRAAFVADTLEQTPWDNDTLWDVPPPGN